MKLHPNVKRALEHNQPVIALESTIISHGFPWPHNFELACELEGLASQMGVVPATIAVIDGQACVGLERDQLRLLAQDGASYPKLSSFDLPWAFGLHRSGATTVAGTMRIAQRAGIEVFATGGIGGVHRGFAQIPDVSHDLQALATTRMAVISAGAKAILDLPATVEMLETLGVLTVGFRCSQFPAFYYADSGIPLTYSVDSVNELARIFAHVENSGMLIVNPVPQSEAMPKAVIEPLISTALGEAAARGITAKKVTPFLLQALNEASKGSTLRTNIGLVKNNIKLGAELACALRKLPHGTN